MTSYWTIRSGAIYILVIYSTQTMVRAQILRYISRPKYTRQSPDCPLVIFSFTALPLCLHCSTSYSSAFAQHCIVTHLVYPPCCTRVYPHRLYPPRVSPSDPMSLLQVRPLPTISSESQQLPKEGDSSLCECHLTSSSGNAMTSAWRSLGYQEVHSGLRPRGQVRK